MQADWGVKLLEENRPRFSTDVGPRAVVANAIPAFRGFGTQGPNTALVLSSKGQDLATILPRNRIHPSP